MAGEKKPTPTPQPTSTLSPNLKEAAAALGIDEQTLAAARMLAGAKTTTGTSTKKYEPYGQQVVYTPSKAKSFVISQFKSLLDREPTPAEIKTWTAKLIAEQKKPSSVAQTTYPVIGGVRTAVSTTGLDEAQWLADSIAADAKLGAELTAVKTQAPILTQVLKDKAVYDKLVADAKGDLDKINLAKQTTTYGQNLAEYEAQIADKFRTTGATNDPSSASEIAKYLLDRGLKLNSQSAESYINSQLKFGQESTGKAGSNVDALNKVALANGLTLNQVFDKAALGDVLSKVQAGEDINTYAKAIRDAAKVVWNVPDNVANLMDQGVSLDSIYNPYKRVYADTLELDPNSVTLNDLAKLGVIGKATKDSQAPQNLYDFQRQLRKDDRWQYTSQARSEVANITQRVLRDFGFMG